MEKNKATILEKVTWGLAALPLLVTLVLLPFLPNTIPAHYNAAGNIDRWNNKYEALVLPAFIPIFTAFWGLFLHNVGDDSTKENPSGKKVNRKMLDFAFLFPIVVFNVMCYVFLQGDFSNSGSHVTITLNRLLAALLSIMDIVLGNYMPKCRQNSLVGIRVPWTLENEDVWDKTHRFGGRIMVITGFALLALYSFLPAETGWLLGIYLAAVAIDIAIMVGYAKHVYDKIAKPNGGQ